MKDPDRFTLSETKRLEQQQQRKNTPDFERRMTANITTRSQTFSATKLFATPVKQFHIIVDSF